MLYFNNAATTFPKPEVLYTETMKLYKNIGINFTRDKSNESFKAIEIREKLNKNIKTILSINGEVIFNSSATFSLNEIIFGLDYSNINTVYISPFEHNAVYRPILEAQRRYGFNLEIIKFNDYELDIIDLELKFMSKNPDLVLCTHASNVFGNILPIKKIFEEVKKYKGITVLDAAQTAGLLDFSDISPLCDFIVFAGHKTLYGPSGIGGYLYNNKNISLKPLLYGGTGIKSEEEDMPLDLPERYEAGSPNILGIIGLKISTDWIIEIGKENLLFKEISNHRRLKQIIEEHKFDINIYSPKQTLGIISITSDKYSPKELELFLNDYQVTVRSGMHCSPLAHNQMNTSENGTLRLSVSYFNFEEEFEQLNEILEEIFF